MPFAVWVQVLFISLVLPRVVAMIFIMPLLTTLADIIGCFGGALISIFEVGVTPSYAINQLITSMGFIDMPHGLIKAHSLDTLLRSFHAGWG